MLVVCICCSAWPLAPSLSACWCPARGVLARRQRGRGAAGGPGGGSSSKGKAGGRCVYDECVWKALWSLEIQQKNKGRSSRSVLGVISGLSVSCQSIGVLLGIPKLSQPSFEPLPSFQGLRKTRRLLQPPRKPNVTLQRGLAFYFSVAFLTLPVLCSVNTAVWPRHALKNVTRIDVDVFQIAGQNTSAVASPCF